MAAAFFAGALAADFFTATAFFAAGFLAREPSPRPWLGAAFLAGALAGAFLASCGFFAAGFLAAGALVLAADLAAGFAAGFFAGVFFA